MTLAEEVVNGAHSTRPVAETPIGATEEGGGKLDTLKNESLGGWVEGVETAGAVGVDFWGWITLARSEEEELVWVDWVSDISEEDRDKLPPDGIVASSVGCILGRGILL